MNASYISKGIPAGVPGITTDMAARKRRGRKSDLRIPPEVPLSTVLEQQALYSCIHITLFIVFLLLVQLKRSKSLCDIFLYIVSVLFSLLSLMMTAIHETTDIRRVICKWQCGDHKIGTISFTLKLDV